ncbi:hypothetical protein SAMN02910339_01340 [Lachnospiraceae bacterium YSD2013]|nr:hypothetical protein SAMN02910339_01340 [Lachnospiraceae bacterium YSD2013]
MAEKRKIRNMCDVAERLEKNGIEIGKKRGIEIGKKRGIKSGIKIGTAQTIEDCAEALNMSVADLMQKLEVHRKEKQTNK